jgi:hypothetical protein
MTRAGCHEQERRPRFDASREEQEQLATRFFGAAEEGDLEGLELAYDVLLHADGGGEAPATYVRSTAAARVARTLSLIGGLRAGVSRFGRLHLAELILEPRPWPRGAALPRGGRRASPRG